VDPELAAMTVTDITRGLMERRLRQQVGRSTEEDAKFALDLLCRGLTSQQLP
jgi:hypothetical protein